MHSKELARLAGVSADTLRYYERRRLMPTIRRSAAGYRLFSPEALVRVRMIRGALALGFSVNELSDIFHERNRLAAEKLVALEARLRELQSCRRDLRETLGEWDRLLARTPHGKPARLLEAFAAAHPKSLARRSPLGVLTRDKRKQEKRQ